MIVNLLQVMKVFNLKCEEMQNISNQKCTRRVQTSTKANSLLFYDMEIYKCNYICLHTFPKLLELCQNMVGLAEAYLSCAFLMHFYIGNISHT